MQKQKLLSLMCHVLLLITVYFFLAMTFSHFFLSYCYFIKYYRVFYQIIIPCALIFLISCSSFLIILFTPKKDNVQTYKQ